jgi:hypothetical protein
MPDYKTSPEILLGKEPPAAITEYSGNGLPFVPTLVAFRELKKLGISPRALSIGLGSPADTTLPVIDELYNAIPETFSEDILPERKGDNPFGTLVFALIYDMLAMDTDKKVVAMIESLADKNQISTETISKYTDISREKIDAFLADTSSLADGEKYKLAVKVFTLNSVLNVKPITRP